jgi:uncharacterized membrane protein
MAMTETSDHPIPDDNALNEQLAFDALNNDDQDYDRENGDPEDGEADDEAGVPEPAARGPKYVCAISGLPIRRKDAMRIADLRPELAERIRRDHPHLPPHALISREALAEVRGQIVGEILRDEHGEITDLERQVIESLAHQEVVSENVEEEFEEHRSLGDRMADDLASFGGSWRFIISFTVVLLIWMAINFVLGARHAFDAYPFMALNLVLSCLAAIQAPIIMMSQKRQEQKDRLRSLNEYRVNLKAELEIRHLHEKMDHLINRQWERLAAIQRIQIELLEELAGKRKPSRPPPPPG